MTAFVEPEGVEQPIPLMPNVSQTSLLHPAPGTG
jgi:hypothetical protein